MDDKTVVFLTVGPHDKAYAIKQKRTGSFIVFVEGILRSHDIGFPQLFPKPYPGFFRLNFLGNCFSDS
jgi:hypothetical protein